MSGWRFWGGRPRTPSAFAPGTFDYGRWIIRRINERRPEYTATQERGLFALLTLVLDQPVEFFDELAWSVQAQDFANFEWIIVDLGATSTLRLRLKGLHGDPRVKVLRAEAPRGLVQGWRLALDSASYRYALPLEASDRLYPDALRIVATFLQQHNYPPVVYSDEDQLLPDGQPTNPFCKPDWDPLLLYSGGYTTRLAVLDRLLALKTGAFTEDAANGCAIWDACCRFVAQGYEPDHLPEILYSRRVSEPRCGMLHPLKHAGSASHVLRNHLRRQRMAEKLNVRANPLPGQAGSWRLAWQRTSRDTGIPVVCPMGSLAELHKQLNKYSDDGLVAIQSANTQTLTADWADEARAVLAALPDAVCVGGCILDQQQRVISAGEFFGLDGLVASPFRGWDYGDTRGHGRLLCQQTVSAPSRDFFVAEVGFLKDLLESKGLDLSLSLLHAWVGAEARAHGYRVAFTPHLLVRLIGDADELRPSAEETWRFLKAHWQQLLDDPTWSRFLSLQRHRAFALASPAERAAVLSGTLCHLAGILPLEEQLTELANQYPSRMHRPIEKRRSFRHAA